MLTRYERLTTDFVRYVVHDDDDKKDRPFPPQPQLEVSSRMAYQTQPGSDLHEICTFNRLVVRKKAERTII